MKSISVILLLFNLSIFTYTSNSQNNITKKDTLYFTFETPPDFLTPESVKYDNINEILYVANINGKPSEKDGNGFISIISTEGEIVNLHWVDGLNAPKGMGIVNNKLFVSDIDRLVEIDISKGEISMIYPAKGAQFLNDIDTDENGNVYVSDMAGNSIWLLKDKKFEKWMEGNALIRPNGLFMNASGLFVGCKNQILKINTETKHTEIFAYNTGSIDGLEEIDENSFIFSDWSGHINILSPDKNLTLVLNTADLEIQAADIEYVPIMHLVFVPTFFHNTVSIYKINKN